MSALNIHDTAQPLPSAVSYLRPELRDLRIIGAEEHVTFPDLVGQMLAAAGPDSHIASVVRHMADPNFPGIDQIKARVADTDETRIQAMDSNGIAMQILSFSGAVNSTHAGVHDAALGNSLARQVNDRLADAKRAHPGRYVPLAELPLHDPAASCDELRRCVNELGFVGAMTTGSIGAQGKYLDDPAFDELLGVFEELDVPLFVHPGPPPKPVWDAYYDLGADRSAVSAQFALVGWGWHNDAGVAVFRMILSGVFDRHPRLKLVTGHLGEGTAHMMTRSDYMLSGPVTGLKRSVGEVLRQNVWISVSGMYSLPPTQMAIATYGTDRLLFGADYPYVDIAGMPSYLKSLGDLYAPADMRRMCQTNAEQLFKVKA